MGVLISAFRNYNDPDGEVFFRVGFKIAIVLYLCIV